MSGRTILLAGFGNRIPPGDLTIMFVVHSAGRTNSAIAELNSAMAEFVLPNSAIAEFGLWLLPAGAKAVILSRVKKSFTLIY
jgi:hypothetical protein